MAVCISTGYPSARTCSRFAGRLKGQGGSEKGFIIASRERKIARKHSRLGVNKPLGLDGRGTYRIRASVGIATEARASERERVALFTNKCILTILRGPFSFFLSPNCLYFYVH